MEIRQLEIICYLFSQIFLWINQGIQANALTFHDDSDNKAQTWKLDTDPIERAIRDGFTCVETMQQERRTCSWIDLLEKEVSSYIARKDKSNKHASDSSAKARKGKLGNSTGDKDGDKEGRRDINYEQERESSSASFTFPHLLPSFTPSIVESLLEIYNKPDSHMNPLEVCMLLQKNILVITSTTPIEWTQKVSIMCNPKFTYGDVHIMGIGVHAPNLRIVHLPYTPSPTELLIQAIGRVGRPTQGVGKAIGTAEQFAQAFSDNYRHMITERLDALSIDGIEDHYVQGSGEDEDEDDENNEDEDDESHNTTGTDDRVVNSTQVMVEDSQEDSHGDAHRDAHMVAVSNPIINASDVFSRLPQECENWEDLLSDNEEEKDDTKEDNSHKKGTRSAEAKKRRKQAYRAKKREQKANL